MLVEEEGQQVAPGAILEVLRVDVERESRVLVAVVNLHWGFDY